MVVEGTQRRAVGWHGVVVEEAAFYLLQPSALFEYWLMHPPRQLRREGQDIARCTVERLMRSTGLQGVIRGKVVRTTVSDKAAPCPLDKVNRQIRAERPDQLWVSDFTYGAPRPGWSGERMTGMLKRKEEIEECLALSAVRGHVPKRR